MAETTKLSVGGALDKLRAADAPESRRAQLDGKIGELDAEIVRLRAARLRAERDQKAGSARDERQEVTATSAKSRKTLWIVAGIVFAVAMLIAAQHWGLF